MRRALFITGVRTPFAVSGTSLSSFRAVDLAKVALKGLIDKTAINASSLSCIAMGNVIQDVNTANIAREAALMAGVPTRVPCHTVTMACISSNAATAHGASLIEAGRAALVIAGGVDIMSDAPIRYSKAIRQVMLASTRIKGGGILRYASLLRSLSFSDLTPETPTISEFSTGETMGHSADRLASRWGVTRPEQDAFALRSHENAAQAHANGHLRNDLVHIIPPPSISTSKKTQTNAPVSASDETKKNLLCDNGIKLGSTLAKLSSLKPSFVKPHGSITAGNSSFLTDGASACLLASEKAVKEHGLTASSQIVDWVFTGSDPKEELLLGPAYAIAELLERNNLTHSDICVWELHEAFAGQVLANLNALDSEVFAKSRGPSASKFGRIPMNQINTWGGSLALGHPFGATGTRLLTMASNRLRVEAEGHGFAVLAACAAGGQGHAMLIRGIPHNASPGPRHVNV